MTARWTSGDVPGQQGRLAVVTGANTGLGFETARVLAARGASVVLAVRDAEKGKAAAARIAGTAPGANVTVQPLDLASLESIRAAAGDAGGGGLALLGVPHGQHHRRATRGEDPGGLEPQAGVRAADHGQPSLLAGHVTARPSRGHDSSRSRC